MLETRGIMADNHAHAHSRAPARDVLEVLRDMSHAEARRGRGRRGVFIWGATPDPDKLGALCLSVSLRETKKPPASGLQGAGVEGE